MKTFIFASLSSFLLLTAFTQENINQKVQNGKWFIKTLNIGNDKNSYNENAKDYYWFDFSDDNTYNSKFLLDENSGTYSIDNNANTITIDFKALKNVPLSITEIESNKLELTGSIGRKKVKIILYQ